MHHGNTESILSDYCDTDPTYTLHCRAHHRRRLRWCFLLPLYWHWARLNNINIRPSSVTRARRYSERIIGGNGRLVRRSKRIKITISRTGRGRIGWVTVLSILWSSSVHRLDRIYGIARHSLFLYDTSK